MQRPQWGRSLPTRSQEPSRQEMRPRMSKNGCTESWRSSSLRRRTPLSARKKDERETRKLSSCSSKRSCKRKWPLRGSRRSMTSEKSSWSRGSVTRSRNTRMLDSTSRYQSSSRSCSTTRHRQQLMMSRTSWRWARRLRQSGQQLNPSSFSWSQLLQTKITLTC